MILIIKYSSVFFLSKWCKYYFLGLHAFSFFFPPSSLLLRLIFIMMHYHKRVMSLSLRLDHFGLWKWCIYGFRNTRTNPAITNVSEAKVSLLRCATAACVGGKGGGVGGILLGSPGNFLIQSKQKISSEFKVVLTGSANWNTRGGIFMAELLQSQHSYIKKPYSLRCIKLFQPSPLFGVGITMKFFLDGVDFQMSKISFVKVKFSVINMLIELAFLWHFQC